MLAALRKDSPSVGDVHVSTALGNEKPPRKKWRRFSAIIGQVPKAVVTPPDTETAKRYSSVKELPDAVKGKLKGKRRRQWMHVFNSSLAEHGDESRAFAEAWSTAQKSDALSGPQVGDIIRVESDMGSASNAPWESEVIWADGWDVKVAYDDGEAVYHMDPANLDDVDGLGKENQHLWFFTKSDALSATPLVGVGGRRIEPYDADTFLVPMRYDSMALSYMREDQIPRVLDAITHPKRLEKTVVNIGDLTAIKNRVSRDSVVRHLRKMGREPGRVDPITPDDHVEGRDDVKPVTVAWMNGGLVLLDGHDRVVAVWLDGGDEIRARFVDVDGYDDTKPDDDDQHKGSAYDLLQGADGRVLTNFTDGTLSVPFMHDPNFFVGLRPDQLPKFTFALTHQDELPDATVPLSSLVAIQNRVNADTVASKVEQGWTKPPVIVRKNGFNYIADGHDRLAAAWLKGADTAAVKLVDITVPDNTMRPEGVAKAMRVDIKKSDPDKRQVFGWMSVCTKGGEYFFDKQDDMILVDALEPAVYEYVLSSRVGGDMHVEKGVSRLIESMMFTKEKQDALGIDLGQEGWWVGYQVDSPPLWDAIKRGERPEFSIGGAAVSMPYDKWLKGQS